MLLQVPPGAAEGAREAGAEEHAAAREVRPGGLHAKAAAAGQAQAPGACGGGVRVGRCACGGGVRVEEVCVGGGVVHVREVCVHGKCACGRGAYGFESVGWCV